MEQEKNICEKKCAVCCGHEHDRKCCKKMSGGGMSGCVYGLAFIGAAIYYVQHSATFWMGVLGILKALVWPAFLIHRLLGFLGM